MLGLPLNIDGEAVSIYLSLDFKACYDKHSVA